MDFHPPAGVDRLPLHRAKIEAASQAGMAIPEMVGMVIAGSFALGIADAYSDVDLKLVSTDEGFDAVVAAQDDLIAACGRIVARFPADHAGLPELTIVLYDDLVHVDFLPIRISELSARNEGLPAAVLWERDGRVTRELVKPHPPGPPVDLEWIEHRMWTWLWYLQSKVLRGEIYEALDGLAWLRTQVFFPLLAATRGETISGARRVEPLLEELASRFASTAPSADRGQAMDALRAAADLYRHLADPLLHERGIDLATDARSLVGAALDEGLQWQPGQADSS